MICGSCGMRMDGRRGARLQGADEADRRERPRAGHLGDGEHADRQGPRRRHGALLEEDPRVKPWLDPGYDEAAERERVVSQEQMNVIHKEALCIMCGCCVSECNSMEADPDFLGPAALAKGMRFVGDPRDHAEVERLERATTTSTASGTAPAATSATSAARRASTRATRSPSSAPSRSSTASTATWAPSTRSGSSPRRRRPAGCARPSSSRRRRASSAR